MSKSYTQYCLMKHVHSRYRGDISRRFYFSSFRENVFALLSTGRHLLGAQFTINLTSYIYIYTHTHTHTYTHTHSYNQVRTQQKSAVLTRTHMTQLNFNPVYFKWNASVTGHILLKLWISPTKALPRTKPFLWADCRRVRSFSDSRTERLSTQNSGNRHSWERSSFGSSVCLVDRTPLTFQSLPGTLRTTRLNI